MIVVPAAEWSCMKNGGGGQHPDGDDAVLWQAGGGHSLFLFQPTGARRTRYRWVQKHQCGPHSCTSASFPALSISSPAFYILVWFRSSAVSAGSLRWNHHFACAPQQSRSIPGSQRGAPAVCRLRITPRPRQEPWEILSGPVRWEASMWGCVGGGMQPVGGMKQATEHITNNKGKNSVSVACLHDLPPFQVTWELRPGSFFSFLIIQSLM